MELVCSVADLPETPQPDTLCLYHKVFGMFETPLFRRADTDQAPVMQIRMGDRDVTMPLRSLAREFKLEETSADGQMLQLVAAALDYVTALRIGDKLPSEVLTGDASWEPSAEHIGIANARLQLQLVEWLQKGSGAAPVQITPGKLATGNVDPGVRELVQTALVRAADELNLPSGQAVLAKIEDLAHELAYIEALRDRLLRRVQSMVVILSRMTQARIKDVAPAETLNRVRQLTDIAFQQIRQRFEEQDAHISEVMSALRHIESHRAFIRSNRDWLYRSQRAWDPILLEWDRITPPQEAGRQLLDRSYAFLAPRFMPVTEWLSSIRPKPKQKLDGMVW